MASEVYLQFELFDTMDSHFAKKASRRKPHEWLNELPAILERDGKPIKNVTAKPVWQNTANPLQTVIESQVSNQSIWDWFPQLIFYLAGLTHILSVRAKLIYHNRHFVYITISLHVSKHALPGTFLQIHKSCCWLKY